MRSALIVVGGSVAISLICFPFGQLWKLFRVFLSRLLGRNHHDYAAILNDARNLSLAFRQGPRAYESQVEKTQHPFFREAAGVVLWLEADVSPAEIRSLLELRTATHFNEYMNEAGIFDTISRYPPALGMMGTVIGLVALLQSLANLENGKEIVGVGMAVALITTLYGLFLANFILQPIAEHLRQQTFEDQKARKMIVEGIMLIHAGRPTSYVLEHMKSHLTPSKRPQTHLQKRTSGTRGNHAA